MPWRVSLMKDVWGRDRPGGVADRALIPGFPNGVTRQFLAVTHAVLVWGGTQGSETSQYL